ncbi:hypothetical protein [Sphingomonas sp. S2-65]|uniref:hypothetical protein n=1 Tax=Sphingomonas sp. S2-65 TaxID=2903960 RepID=UPI001F3FBADE|nr:hypothetical protein [Sphingomonas sp. S2-65]UYY57401.1 hypothetical protein LZ586_12020 [Sphingomonas sp. S2-65]
MRITTVPALGSLLLMCAPAQAAPRKAEAETYSIRMQIYDGDELIGRPQLTAKEGQPFTVEAVLPTGKGYTVAAALTRTTSNTVAIKARIEVLSPGVRRSMSPEMSVTLGSAASFTKSTEGAPPIRVIFEVGTDQTASKSLGKPE